MGSFVVAPRTPSTRGAWPEKKKAATNVAAKVKGGNAQEGYRTGRNSAPFDVV